MRILVVARRHRRTRKVIANARFLSRQSGAKDKVELLPDWAAVHEARRATVIAGISSVLSIAVIITAFAVPYLQQHIQDKENWRDRALQRLQLIGMLSITYNTQLEGRQDMQTMGTAALRRPKPHSQQYYEIRDGAMLSKKKYQNDIEYLNVEFNIEKSDIIARTFYQTMYDIYQDNITYNEFILRLIDENPNFPQGLAVREIDGMQSVIEDKLRQARLLIDLNKDKVYNYSVPCGKEPSEYDCQRELEKIDLSNTILPDRL